MIVAPRSSGLGSGTEGEAKQAIRGRSTQHDAVQGTTAVAFVQQVLRQQLETAKENRRFECRLILLGVLSQPS